MVQQQDILLRYCKKLSVLKLHDNFTENALLPGLVTSHYDQERAAQDYHSGLKEEGRK